MLNKKGKVTGWTVICLYIRVTRDQLSLLGFCQAGVNWEEGISIEKMLLSYWPLSMSVECLSVEYFLGWCLIWQSLAHCGSHHPLDRWLGLYKTPANKQCSSMTLLQSLPLSSYLELLAWILSVLRWALRFVNWNKPNRFLSGVLLQS